MCIIPSIKNKYGIIQSTGTSCGREMKKGYNLFCIFKYII